MGRSVVSKTGPSERELIRRFRDGDEAAFQALIDECREQIRARVARWLSPAVQRRVSVADVMQDVGWAAFQRRADLEDRGPGSFRRWLLGIADRRARNAIDWHAGADKRAVGREALTGDRPATTQMPGRAPSPSQVVIAAESAEVARAAVATLSSDHRTVLRLIRVERLTMREAAARLGRSPDAVKKLYGRALRAFADRYNQLRGESRA